MALELWIAFATACFLLSAIPGPSVLVVTSQALSGGKLSALICIAGELLGGVCLMIMSLLGVGALVSASPEAFNLLKWLGVGYLLYLGAAELRSALKPRSLPNPPHKFRGSFFAGFWTALFNPKSLIFYLAFFTQFIDASSPLFIQYILLVTTAAVIAGLVLGVYAFLADRAKGLFSSTSSQRKVSGLSGVFYIAGGLLVAATR